MSNKANEACIMDCAITIATFSYGAGTGSRTLVSSLGRIHNSRYTIPAYLSIISYPLKICYNYPMQEIREQLKSVIKDLYGLDFDPELTPSPDNIDADYSSNAPLKLAKSLHRSPMEIANEVEKTFISQRRGVRSLARREVAPAAHGRRPEESSEERTGSFFRDDDGSATSVDGPAGRAPECDINVSSPGFLNFSLTDDYLKTTLDRLVDNYGSDVYKGQTVICEFSDPNPFKVLHVGHLYTSIVGDSIARLFEYAGAKVIRANFGGDVGLHVAKTMYALQQKPIKDLTIEDIAKCYIEGTALYDTDEKTKKEITELNKEIYRINAEGVSHGRVTSLEGDPQNVLRSKNFGGGNDGRTRPEDKLAELYWRGRELSYQYFKDFYATIGVHFDKYYPESTVAALGLAKVKEQLKKGIYEMSDGAVIFDGDKYGLHTRVFINKEGVPTYEAKDVGLIFTKWQDYHFDKSVVITGNEQLDYMRVVLKSVEQYAPELVEKTTHLTHGLVKLPGGVKMSSRKGNFLKAVDVLEMVKSALKEEHGSTDETVSLAATKYAFLKYKMGGNIIFDPEESVKMTGNSGPYLLYSCVRAKKILNKVGSVLKDDDTTVLHRRVTATGVDPKMFAKQNFGEGKEPAGPAENMAVSTRVEHNIMKKILEYSTLLDEAVSELAPHKVANYLYELAQAFSRFYENCEVIGSDQEAERIKLVEKYLNIMTHGLGLLGIAIPEEM